MTSKEKYEKDIKIIVSFIAIVFVLLTTVFPYVQKNNIAKSKVIKEKEVGQKEIDNSAFKNIEIEAKSAIVVDATNNNIYFSKNESAQLPLASITKVMTAIVATENNPKDASITITKDDLQQEGDSGLKQGEKWNLEELLKFTLIVSSNDGARSVASAATYDQLDPVGAFILKMNNKAKELRMDETFFLNESGLDVNETLSGAYGSAKDVSALLMYAIKKYPHLFEVTTYKNLSLKSESGYYHNLKNTNQSIEYLPSPIASKTGFTDLAGGNLAVSFDAGIDHPIIVVVLGSTTKGRFEDVNKLTKAAIMAISGNKNEQTLTR